MHYVVLTLYSINVSQELAESELAAAKNRLEDAEQAEKASAAKRTAAEAAAR